MKKRVLIVASGGLDKSGVPSVIMTIVRQLRQEYAFDILLSARNVGYFEQEFLDCGGRIFRYKKKRFSIGALNTLADFFRPVSLYFITRRMLAREGPYHAVHCHNEFDMAGSLAAAAVQGVPLRIGHVHKTWAGRGGPLTRAYRFLCRKAINAYATARLGCSSQANAAFYGAEASAQAVNNPYDETRFFPDAGETAENGDIRMVQVGYFCENKNQRFTVEVLAELLKMGRDARLCLAGDARGAYGKALEEEIRAWGLQERVTLLPPDADIPALMKKSNLLLLPSRAEGFGMVLIEAQAVGLSCYASDTVPRETNLGGVKYLPLAAGPRAWAETIAAENSFARRIPRDCGAFSTEAFANAIREAYRIKNA